MNATLVVQLLIAIVGQLPELVKLVEELRASGAQTLTDDQVERCQAIASSVKSAAQETWPQPAPAS